MITISFSEFTTGRMALIDLDTVPPHMRSDYELRNRNLMRGNKLCRRCDGTGNEFLSMYRCCGDCWGTGVAKTKRKPAAFSIRDSTWS
jgi:hypothetical protein